MPGHYSQLAATQIPLLAKINEHILNPVIYLLFGLAFVQFVIGVALFVVAAGDEEKRSIGKKHMLWGLLGLFVMVSVFGILNLLIDFVDMF